MTTAERVGAWIRDYRNRLRISQEALGERVRSDGPRIAKLEKGTENPTLKTLDDLAAALGVNVRSFFQPRPTEGDEDAEGSSVLERAIQRAKSDGGTWRADVAEALTALAKAIGRDGDQGQDSTGSGKPRR